MFLAPFALLLAALLPSTESHGRLIDPPSRASAWRYGFDTPHNYNDHELYCGGFTRQWVKNEGKCGVCGDAWDSKLPRAHEFGGTYGQAVVVRKYNVGGIINIRVELTANHFGYFEFAVCADYKTASQNCLSKNLLRLVKPQENVEHHNGVRFFPKDGNKVYEMKYRLPKKKCEHCLLQWRYVAGNNWGNCPNGTGAVGCGPQEEFRACADIAISGKAGDEETLQVPDEPTTQVATSSTTQTPHVTAEESYSPVSALVLSLVSFLVVFLVLSLLYIHFYQVGKQVKNWLKSGESGKTRSGGMFCNNNAPPLPPPRTKKSTSSTARSNGGDGLDEIDLRGSESMA